MNIPDSFKLEIGDNLAQTLGHLVTLSGILTGVAILGAVVVSTVYLAT